MLTAAKVFIIIGMISGWWTVLPIVFGILALKKMKTATCKAEAKSMAICALIFCSLLGGIFMLCAPDEQYANYN